MDGETKKRTHQVELRRLVSFAGCISLLFVASYAFPVAEPVRPWINGEAIPLVHYFEDFFDDPAVTSLAQTPSLQVAEAEAMASPKGLRQLDLPERDPAVRTHLELPEGALDAFFEALSAAEAGEPGRIVRVLHWGDSTIAGDGITATIRERLQGRFGDGGPGFLAVQVDPRWAYRPGVARWPKGDWETLTIAFGGAPGNRYGLAGTVSIANPARRITHADGSIIRYDEEGNPLPSAVAQVATDNSSTATGDTSEEPEAPESTTTPEPEERTATVSTLGGVKIKGVQQPIHRFDLFYQMQPGGGSMLASVRGQKSKLISTAAGSRQDGFHEILVSNGAPYLTITAQEGGPVAVYGAALETAGPGVTWEPFGVTGASITSLMRQSKSHLSQQVERRNPDLIVLQTGGNEVRHAGLKKDGGVGYKQAYLNALARLRSGAVEVPCLIMAPPDQATRERGRVVSKQVLTLMIELQRQAALEAGCAFWDTRNVMGGEGGFARWLENKPSLAWTDLMHLTKRGQELVGNSFADALLAHYDHWLARRNPREKFSGEPVMGALSDKKESTTPDD